MKKYRGVTHHRRHVVGDGAQWMCVCCGKYLGCKSCDPTLSLKFTSSIDHINPLVLGGSVELDNFQLMCGRCNVLKADLIIEGPLSLAAIHEARRKRRLAKPPKHKNTREDLATALSAARSREEKQGLPAYSIAVHPCLGDSEGRHCNKWHLKFVGVKGCA